MYANKMSVLSCRQQPDVKRQAEDYEPEKKAHFNHSFPPPLFSLTSSHTLTPIS